MKKLIIIFILTILALLSAGEVNAYSEASASSAKLSSTIKVKPVDDRAMILREFLASYNSPMVNEAENFVKYADKYDLDWRLVASIAGLESGFGKHIPYESYNGWGWGVYGDNVIRFNSWEHGIETISKGLRENYLKDKPESDPYFIGPTYASSPTWAVRVEFFMNRMEQYRVSKSKDRLTLAF